MHHEFHLNFHANFRGKVVGTKNKICPFHLSITFAQYCTCRLFHSDDDQIDLKHLDFFRRNVYIPVFCFGDNNATLKKLHSFCHFEITKIRVFFQSNRRLIYHGASVHISSHYSMLLINNFTSISAL